MKKTILISGVNRGIGKQLFYDLTKEGNYVIGLVRNEVSKKKLLDELNKQTNLSYEVIVCDITDEEGLYFLGQNLSNSITQIDILINNAGIGIGENMLKDCDFSEVKSFFDVNFFGAWRLYQTLDSLLVSGSRIINVSSSLGLKEKLREGGLPAYKLSKWALNGFTIQLSAELVSRKIDVVAVCPGWTKTDMGGQDAPNSIEEGISTIKWLCLNPDIISGSFYRDQKIREW